MTVSLPKLFSKVVLMLLSVEGVMIMVSSGMTMSKQLL